MKRLLISSLLMGLMLFAVSTSGYVSAAQVEAYDEKTGLLTFDEIEWVMQTDAKRVSELGLDASLDFPNGYYIYNESDQTDSLKVAENVKVYIVNWHDLANHTLTDVNGLAERVAEYQAPYHLTIEDGVIVEISEQYTP